MSLSFPIARTTNSLVPQISSDASILRELILRQQQEQQLSLLAQRVSAVTGAANPLSDDSIALAILLRQNQQREEQDSLMGLRNLQARAVFAPYLNRTVAAPVLPAPNSIPPTPEASTASAGSREAYAAAGLTGLSQRVPLALPPDRRRKGRVGTFPQKLHQMFADLSRAGKSDVASFLPHGRAFTIRKPQRFANEVMKKYFRMSRFSSFQRQLNLYDFQRITDGDEKGAYFHELFVQDRPVLSTMMKRIKIKGAKRPTDNSQASATVKEVSLDGDDEEVIVEAEPAADYAKDEEEC